MQKLILVAVAVLCAVPAASEAGLIQYTANPNPATTDGYISETGNQFWTFGLGGTVSCNPINDGGTLAWDINTAGGGAAAWAQYTINPTDADVTEGNTNGWVLTTTLRLPTTSDAQGQGVAVYYANGSKAWLMQFGTQADGDPIVGFLLGGSYVLEGAGNTAYHTYKVVYDPVAGSADLFVDGVERISNFGGFNVTFKAVSFGDTTSGDSGRGYYNFIEWYSIPEPATVGLMGVGLAAVLALRRRR